jgi:two-component system cell cycle response regulator
VSLRGRLWLVLGGLFLVPLAVGALVLLLVVPDARNDQVSADVDSAAVAVHAELTDECRNVGLAARVGALESVVGGPETAVGNLVSRGDVDYAIVLDGSGAAVATAGALPGGNSQPAQLRQCSTERPTGAGAVVAERVGIDDPAHPGRVVVVAKRLDRELLDEVRARSGTSGQVVLLDGKDVVVSTLAASTTRALVNNTDGRTGRVQLDGWVARVDAPGRDTPWTVVVAAEDPDTGSRTGLLLLILLAAALVAGLLVTLVARGLSQPYTDIADAAERVARGDLDADITPATDREAGRLGSAFNQMTGELRRSMAALERSREDLRDSLERIGDTLTSTHDLDGLLQVVLETAVVTLQGKAGVVLHLSADRLQLVGEHGLHEAGLPAPAAVSPGSGVLGQVVSSGDGVRGRIGSGPPALAPVATEPGRGDVLAVPIRSMGNVIGVIALYDRLDGRPFEAADEDALRTLAGQASIAVDNVHLHHEAQRLSTTDPLTGLWNFRYLSMSLAREIERSTRFDRPLAVLMLDLDHFKLVNDVHGHARGDSVLRELAHRVQEQIREVDTFARYGGEEFVVVLPETTVEGAAQLAERICQAVRREPFLSEGEPPLDITVSVGGAAFPEQGSTPATLMRSADRALYVAKGDGRDRWHVPGAPDGAVPGR